MTRKHQDPRWTKVRADVKPRLMSALPSPCPRCGQAMVRGMKLDLGHASLDPALHYTPGNLRLEHRGCNRRDGQRISAAIRASRSKKKKGMPAW